MHPSGLILFMPPRAIGTIMTLMAVVLLPLPALSTEADKPASVSGDVRLEKRSPWNPINWKWRPTDEEIQKYRQSWNPMANGPILLTSVDISPKGQFLSQFFVFGETGHQSFDNKLTTNRTDSPTHLNAIAPFLLVGYGLTDHVEINVAPTAIYWQANQMTAG
jgi:hypothetical protein